MSTCFVCNLSNRPSARFCGNCRAPLLLQNKYRITRLLGRGGYGAVYQAEHTGLGGAAYAIKELVPSSTASPTQQQASSEQFRFEASTLAKLSHPALPKVTDFFTEGNRDYLVMELIEGDTLEDILTRRRAPFAEAQVVAWAQELCDALTYLHTRQPSPVIHRDVKPANLKFTPDGKLKLIDFGIAKLLASGTGTASAARAVSAPYSPMEQYGTGTDARSDIYALGVTLYQLLTNHLPPEAPDRAHETTFLPRQWNPALSVNIQVVVLKAMAEKPADRFQSAAEMKQALVTPMLSVGTPPYQPAIAGPQVLVRAPAPVSAMPNLPPAVPHPTDAAPAEPSHTFARLIAALGVIFLLCVAATGLALYFASSQQGQAAATVQARTATTLAQANQTATAQAATATAALTSAAIARGQATDAALAATRAKETAQALWTATPTLVSGTVILSDTFDYNKNGWPYGDSTEDLGILKKAFANGKYRVEAQARRGGISFALGPVMNSISDFKLTVEVQKMSGSSDVPYGVQFRWLDSDNTYSFLVTDKDFSVYSRYKGGGKALIYPSPTSAIQVGKVNRLGVKAQGTHFVFFINDQQVGEVDDSQLSAGRAALYMEFANAGDQAVFEFDNFEVRAP